MTMRRISWPIDLGPAKLRRESNRPSLGVSTSMTGDVQTVRQPYGRPRWGVEFAPVQGRLSDDLAGFLDSLEDGSNWTTIPGSAHNHELRPASLGLQSFPSGGMPWSNGESWSNGENWQSSFPLASVYANAAVGAFEVQIDVTIFGGDFWRGIEIGFMHFGAYKVGVVSLSGNIATVRLSHGLRKAVVAGEYVTLEPVVAVRLVPGQWTEGDLDLAARFGAQATFSEVPDDIVREHTA